MRRISIVLILSAHAALPCAADAEPPKFGLAGNDTVLWAYQRRADEETGLYLLRYAYLTPDLSPEEWRAMPLAPLDGKVVQSLAAGKDLHVMYSDGGHFRYAAALPLQPAGNEVERTLPHRTVPKAWAVDPPSGVIQALIEKEAADTLPAYGIVCYGFSDTASGLSLVRYADHRWRHAGPLPQEVTSWREGWLVIRSGMPHLFYSTYEEPDAWQHVFVFEAGWSDPAKIDAEDDWHIVNALTVKDEVLLVLTDRNKTSFMVRTNKHGRWSEDVPLNNGGVPAWFLQGDPAFASYRGRLAVANVDEDQRLWVGFWPTVGGNASTSPLLVESLIPRPQPWFDDEDQTLATYIGLAVLMLIIFMGRSDSILQPQPVGMGRVPARYSRRLAAFLLDCIFASPLILPAAYPLVVILRNHFWSSVQGMVPPQLPWIPQLAAVAVFSAYATVCEILWEATPGKRLLGCRVVSEGGGRCSSAAVVGRNALRLIEFFPPFQAIPIFVLILLTRNRQRFGDLVARTVVVEGALQPSETPDSEQSVPPNTEG